MKNRKKANSIRSIRLDRLIDHPDNPNQQSGGNFRKLVSNIKRSGLYEPIVVRPHPTKKGYFQIINGYHRCKALRKGGYKEADCVVWEVDDEQTDIYLSTLNHLGGKDEIGKKVALLKRLNKKLEVSELGKLLPGTAKQIELLSKLDRPKPSLEEAKFKRKFFAKAMVFFLDSDQRQMVENALSAAVEVKEGRTRAAANAAALTTIARGFLENL